MDYAFLPLQRKGTGDGFLSLHHAKVVLLLKEIFSGGGLSRCSVRIDSLKKKLISSSLSIKKVSLFLLNALKKFSFGLSRLIANIFYFLILGLRPLFGPATCKFSIGCTEYALLELKQRPLNKAVYLIARRLLRCNPFTNN